MRCIDCGNLNGVVTVMNFDVSSKRLAALQGWPLRGVPLNISVHVFLTTADLSKVQDTSSLSRLSLNHENSVN